MCDRPATSDEHVPPKCFFPEKDGLPPGFDYRKNMITVPSCENHNLLKSGDDEYLRLVIATCYKNNKIPEWYLTPKIDRALKRRPQLGSLFKDPHPAIVSNQSAIACILDKPRFDRSISLIANALNFYHYKDKWPYQFMIYSPVLIKIDTNYQPEIEPQMQHFYASTDAFFKCRPREGSNQEIFYYQIDHDRMAKILALRMVFYQGFIVVAYSSPKTDPAATEILSNS